jgi:hypothetical protein
VNYYRAPNIGAILLYMWISVSGFINPYSNAGV